MCTGSGMELQLCTEVVLVTHPHSGLCPSHGSPHSPLRPHACRLEHQPSHCFLTGSREALLSGKGGCGETQVEMLRDQRWTAAGCPVREGVGRLGVWGCGSGEAWGAWRSGMERS